MLHLRSSTRKLKLTVNWRMVGNPYLGITSGLPVTREQSWGSWLARVSIAIEAEIVEGIP